MLRVGLISDTHGLLRPEAEAFLRGSDFIVHAGDIGGPEILARLGAIAPVTAVRGNNDHGAWADALAVTEWLKVGGVLLHVVHDLAELDVDARAAGLRVVVSGHSHRPRVEERDGVLFVNPGSPGPRRFRLPISVGELLVTGDEVTARTVELET
jgi:putative phosphoesterase